MKIKLDNAEYEKRSQAFMEWLGKHLDEIRMIKSNPGVKEDLVFSLACLLDGSANMMCEGKEMMPYLGFQLDGEEEVVFDDGKVALHETIDFWEDDEDEDADEGGDGTCPFCGMPVVEGMKTCDNDDCIEQGIRMKI